jgi:hypothetical protein
VFLEDIKELKLKTVCQLQEEAAESKSVVQACHLLSNNMKTKKGEPLFITIKEDMKLFIKKRKEYGTSVFMRIIVNPDGTIE